MESWLVLLGLAVLSVPVLLVVGVVMLVRLRGRVAELEHEVEALWNQRAAASEAADEPTLADWVSRPAAPQPERVPATPSPPTPRAEPVAAPPVEARPAPTPPPLPPRDTSPLFETAATAPPPPSRPDPLSLAFRAVRRWFTEGNVPVKVGMLVLFAGVAALLKYASDQGWLRMPIEFRLSGVALAAIGGLVFAWRQRHARRSFALALQGGAVGVLLLTVFAAFKLYGLLPSQVAFALSIVLVAALGVLAVAQNALALAVLGLLAGFLAPLWLSTGEGNHVALFGYYTVLNLAIFGIAWQRAWRILNALGFGFTFGIGTLWGALRYRPEDFASTEPFLLVFFALYLAIPLLYARRRAPGRRDLIDGCLLFGTPLVAFALQAGMLEGARMTIAFNALGLAALYALLAAAVRRSERLAPFVLPYVVLAVGFATLAVPLALSAEATASVFALEGAGLLWLGVRQQRRLPQLTGAGLQLASAVAFFLAISDTWFSPMPVGNATYMATLLLAIAGFASAWTYRNLAGPQAAPLAALFYVWALAWWLGGGLREIELFAPRATHADAQIALAALTAWLAAEAFARQRARALAWTSALLLATPLLLAWVQQDAHRHPFGDYGVFAWLAYGGLGLRALRCLRGHEAPEPALAHGVWWLSWGLAASLALAYAAESGALGAGWVFAAGAAPWLALAALLQWRETVVAVPFGSAFAGWREALRTVLAAGFALAAFIALFHAGDSAPLAYVPLLNPLDLAQLAMLAMLTLWWRFAPEDVRPWRGHVMAAAGLAFVTAVTLRATHHWGDVPWDVGMGSSSLVQTALTVVWSVLGVAGWIAGSRRGMRALWLAGAVLMGVVLAKLVLIDRGHLGNLLGIVSFLAYGLLCTAVGYFAPVPPRTRLQEAVP